MICIVFYIFVCFRVGEMGAKVLNSKVRFTLSIESDYHPVQVEPIVQGALSTLSLGKKAFKFTRIELGNAKPQISNIR